MDGRARVLFLDTTNSVRSQMAEAFLNRFGADHFQAHSAGLLPVEIHPLTLRVMAEIGYDLGGQCAKGVREYLGRLFFRYLIIPRTPTGEDCPRVWPGVSERFFWPVDDPTTFGGPERRRLNKFREVRDQISQLTKAWVAERIDLSRVSSTRPQSVPAGTMALAASLRPLGRELTAASR